MITWRIDKHSRVPVYVQLRDLIRYHVSTGGLAAHERLPGVLELSRTLGVNFETVRKAYKELEREGLIKLRRGMGTFVASRPARRPRTPRVDAANDDELIALGRRLIVELLETGVDPARARAVLQQAFDDVTMRQFVIFTECNAPQVEEIADLLRRHLPVKVRGVLLSNLTEEVARAMPTGHLSAVITTGFHVNEVRKSLRGVPLDVDFVVTGMAPDTRRQIEALPAGTRFGFVCRDRESIPFYRDLLAAELSIKTDISCCTTAEHEALTRMLVEVDAVLATPPVFHQVQALAPAGLPVFSTMDRVEPVSLRAIKERVFHA